MTVTAKEVAEIAGVSPITVSRAFSGTHPVAKQTRERIFAVADDLGYSPDLLARALVQKHSAIVGISVLELSNPFFAPIIDAVQAEVRQHGHMLITSQSERDKELELLNLNQFKQIRVAGVLLTPVSTDMSHLHSLIQQGLNLVVVARTWEDGNFVCVDNLAGGRMVGEHFAGLGHENFGLVTWTDIENSALQVRIRGFQEAVEEAGYPLLPEHIISTESLRIDQGRRAADLFLDLPIRPTAVFVTADRLAIGFVHRLRQRGVRIPEDLAVIGYDDIRYSEFLEVPLTTVALPKWEMGHKAAQILFNIIDSAAATEPQQLLLPPKLIIRESCGAALAQHR